MFARCCFFVSLWKFFFRRFPEVFRRYFNNIIYLFPLFQEIQSHSSYLPTKPSLVSSGSGANQLTAQMNGQIYSHSPLSLNPRETSPSPCMYLRPADLRTGDSTSPPVPPIECRVSTGLHVLLLADVSSWYLSVLCIGSRECPCYTIVCF